MRLPRLPLWIRAALIAAVAVVLINTLVATLCAVSFDGMENSIIRGERVLINRWSYGFRIPFTTARILEGRASKGDILLFNNPNPDDPYMPVWCRGTFIGRCIGTPGDTLMLDKELLVAGGKVITPQMKRLYSYPEKAEDLLIAVMTKLGIRNNRLAGYHDGKYIRSFSLNEYSMLRRTLAKDFELQPLAADRAECDSVHPFVIPSKGARIMVYPWNMTLLCNTISHHEGKVACIRNDSLIVEGRYAKSYKFENDYYWITSNNPLNVCDSRLFGFVPQSHLIGRSTFVLFSPQKERLLKKIE